MGILCFDIFAFGMIYLGWRTVYSQQLPIDLDIEPQSLRTAGWCFLFGGALILIASLGFALHVKALGMLFVVGFVVIMAGVFTLAIAYQRQNE